MCLNCCNKYYERAFHVVMLSVMFSHVIKVVFRVGVIYDFLQMSAFRLEQLFRRMNCKYIAVFKVTFSHKPGREP